MTNETKQKVREFYDEIGWMQEDDGNYQNARYEDLRPVSREYIHKTRLRVLNGLIPTGRFMLDAGSGPVQYEEYKAYSAGYEKRVCLDISIQALREARTRIGCMGCSSSVTWPIFPLRKMRSMARFRCMRSTILRCLNIRVLMVRSIVCSPPGRTAAIVNGWSDPWLGRMAEPFIGLMRKLSGRSAKKKKEWLNDESPAGTFVEKMSPAWLKREIGSKMTIELNLGADSAPASCVISSVPLADGHFCALSFGSKASSRNSSFGKKFTSFAENGQYPLIVVKKK
jgi:hypothetical protein